jgi:hypothetical protein
MHSRKPSIVILAVFTPIILVALTLMADGSAMSISKPEHSTLVADGSPLPPPIPPKPPAIQFHG